MIDATKLKAILPETVERLKAMLIQSFTIGDDVDWVLGDDFYPSAAITFVNATGPRFTIRLAIEEDTENDDPDPDEDGINRG